MAHRILICAAALLLFPPTAHAATATVENRVLRVVAAPGDVDWLSLHRGSDNGPIAISDVNGRTVIAGAGCTADGGNAVCDMTAVDKVVVELGDMDDQATTSSYGAIPARLEGGPGNDVLTEGAGPNELDGGEGDDWLVSYSSDVSGPDSLSGGPGYDLALFNQRFEPLNLSLDDVANDGAVGEQDNLHSDVEEVLGGYKDDVLTGSDGDDHLNGGDGVDELHGLGGDDTLDGWIGCTRDRLYGEGGDDTLILQGAGTADGGADDDTFRPGIEDCGLPNTVIGGPGSDTADYSDSYLEDVEISLDDVADDGEYGVDDFRSDIENLVASDHGMTLIGGPGPNTLTGGAGDDLLIGAGGADDLEGGDGYDIADYSDHAAAVHLTLDGQANDGAAGEGDWIRGDVEDLRGGAGDDTLAGDDGDNVLDGGSGADVLQGGGGLDGVDYSSRERAVRVDLDASPGDGEEGEGDTVGADVEGIFGGAGADVLTGNAADGFLVGFEGDDLLRDGGGEDVLDGGIGADQLASTDGAADEVTCGAGGDRAWRDAIDLVYGCEQVVNGVFASGSEATPTPAPIATPTLGRIVRTVPPKRPPVTPLDRSAPSAKVAVATRARLATVRRRGLSVSVRCSEACRATAQLEGKRGVVARATLTAYSTSSRTLHLKVGKAGRRALRTGRYVLKLEVSDRLGNVRKVVRTMQVR